MVLEWMVKNKVTTIDDAGYVVSSYYKDKAKVWAGKGRRPLLEGYTLGAAMREYKELLDLITNIESSGTKRAVSYVKMDVRSGEPLSVTPRSFQELLSEIPSSLFAAPLPKQKKSLIPQIAKTQTQQPQRQPPQELIAQRIEPGQQAAAKPEPKAPPPKPLISWPKQAPQKPQPAAAPRPQPKPLEQSAAEELQKVVTASRITTSAPAEEVYVPSSKLVLPTLSLTDQVAELDKIIKNLKASSFDGDQMAIVKEEVVGLSKMAQQKSVAPAEGLDKDLMELRRTRISEALSLMGDN
jgi:hypothetical protein